MKFRNAFAALLISTTLPVTAGAQSLNEAQIKELVLETIRENPEIIMEAVAILEKARSEDEAASKAEVLSSQREALENDPNAPVLGNPDGDVTVVEFFDYNCPYCRKAKEEVHKLIQGDANVRVVYREWPILSEDSIVAAKAALAARNQGKYEDFHNALMGLNGRIDERAIMKVASKLKLDTDQLKQDMESQEIADHIETSNRLARELGFSGTPSFVIGENLVPGFVEASALAELVKEARNPNE